MVFAKKYLTLREVYYKIRFVLAFSAKYRKAVYLLTFAKLIEIPVTLFLPLISAIVIDDCIIARDLNLLNLLIIVGIIFFGVRMLCDAAFSALNNNYNLLFGRDFQFYVLERIMIAPYDVVNESSTGTVTSRIMEDANSIVQILAMLLPNLLCLFINTLVLMTICFSLNISITILILLLMPFNLLYSDFWGKRQYNIGLKQRQTIQELYSIIAIYINSIRDYKANRNTHIVKQFYRKTWLKNAKYSLYMGFLNFVLSYGKSISNGIFYIGINYYLLSNVIRGNISFGFFVAFLAYINMLSNNLYSYAKIYRNLLSVFPAFTRVFEFLPEVLQTIDKPKDIRKSLTNNGITIYDLTYQYQNGIPIFTHMSMTIKENQMIVLTGDNGSGKTTLINLMCGLLRPKSGKIYIGNYDIAEYHECQLRNNLVVIYCDNHIGIETTSCGIKPIGDFIFPAYDKASTGERLIYQFQHKIQNSPRIILLDEPFANLDDTHKRILLQELKKLKLNTTIFLASHNWQDFKDLTDAVYMIQDRKVIRIW